MGCGIGGCCHPTPSRCVCVSVCVCGASKIPFGLQQSPLIMSVKMQLRLFLSTPGDTPSPLPHTAELRAPTRVAQFHSCHMHMHNEAAPKKKKKQPASHDCHIPATCHTRYPTDQQYLLNMLHTSGSGLEISNS